METTSTRLFFYDEAMCLLPSSKACTSAELVISRNDMWSLNYLHAAELLCSLSNNALTFAALRCALTLRFEGVDNNIKAWSDLPQAVHFIRSLSKQWPFFLHFLDRESGDLTRVLAMLNDTKKLPTLYGHSYQYFAVSKQANVVMIVGALNLNKLHGAFNLQQYNDELEQDVKQFYPKV